jgi:hypothetical protein
MRLWRGMDLNKAFKLAENSIVEISYNEWLMGNHP